LEVIDMPRKINSSLIDHAASLVKVGFTVKFAAAEIGIDQATLSRKLKEIGVKVVRPGPGLRKTDLPIEEIKAMYEGGHSENAVAKHFGVDRGTIRKRLLNAGVSPRTQSEAEQLKWSKMDQQTRANQVKKAHDSIRGRPKTMSSKIAFAKTRERLKYDHLIGHGEIEFIEFLRNKGVGLVHQKAIQCYNVDIAIGNIAVELAAGCGRYTMFNPKEINRAEKLLERGYHVVAVEFDSVHTLIQCAEEVFSYIKEAGRLKPVDREYWVIRCRAKDYTIVMNNLGQFTSVPSPVEFLTKRTVVYLD
jgi:DNA-binding protein Fis